MDTAHTTFIKKANGDIEERSQNKIFTSTELYTRDYLAARLEEAADTLKRLPRAIARPRLTAWPDEVLDAYTVRADDFVGYRPNPPTPGAIDRMDEALAWLMPLNQHDRRLLWARALKISWRRLEDLDGRSRPTLTKLHKQAIDNLKDCLLQKS